MRIERKWANSLYLPTLVKFYQSKIHDNIILADNILDELTLNPNEASYILKIIRNIGPRYKSTYYLAKMKKRTVKNYILVKRKK